MHRGHDHDHHSLNGAGGSAGPRDSHAGPGHNHARDPRRAAQWQAPHLREGEQGHRHGGDEAADLDQVEAAFVEGFAAASDPTSFLRLANVPFETTAADGTRLVLLRVEVDAVTDVGSIMPHLGGETFRYDPLPAAMVSRRRRLRFVYRHAAGLRALSFNEVRALDQQVLKRP
jgi:hypothetical protein